MVVSTAAPAHDFGDHVSVIGPLVPKPPEAVKAFGELDVVGINVSCVGGGKSKTYPRGTSARARADGVDDGSLKGGEWLFSNGLNFTAIEGKRKDFASYRFKFVRHGAGEPVDVQGEGFSLLHPGSEGVAV